MTTARCLSCSETVLLEKEGLQCPICRGNLWIREKPPERNRFLGIRPEQLALDGLWLFRDSLPVSDVPPALRAMPIGGSPLVPWQAEARRLGMEALWLKDDTRLPSCSFKDRATAVVLAWALNHGGRVLATASTGNAGCSTACLGAMAGVPTVVFVPARAPANKVAQLQYFGAQVIQVDGSYDDAFDLCRTVCEVRGWTNRSTGLNPFTREGKKTVSFEICCQMGFQVPDIVVVPTGDGNILSGVYKGFLELMQAGISERLPRLLAIQSSSSNALMQAWRRCQQGIPAVEALTAVPSSSVADSICVDLPRDGLAALEALSRTQGEILEVPDREILSAMAELPAKTGIFVEPAAAAGIAGLRTWASRQQPDTLRGSRVVCLLTGNGLKDPQAATSLLPVPLRVPADPDEVLRLL